MALNTKFVKHDAATTWKNLTPSHFASSCSREQCKLPEAVLAFTLMDYDVITKNDFGGEAFMSLSTVPGGRKLAQKWCYSLPT